MSISIHALRVEGDSLPPPLGRPLPVFLSTPSGWRATQLKKNLHYRQNISIHALRVEGDNKYNETPQGGVISIHALRVEGDRLGTLT